MCQFIYIHLRDSHIDIDIAYSYVFLHYIYRVSLLLVLFLWGTLTKTGFQGIFSNCYVQTAPNHFSSLLGYTKHSFTLTSLYNLAPDRFSKPIPYHRDPLSSLLSRYANVFWFLHHFPFLPSTGIFTCNAPSKHERPVCCPPSPR